MINHIIEFIVGMIGVFIVFDELERYRGLVIINPLRAARIGRDFDRDGRNGSLINEKELQLSAAPIMMAPSVRVIMG